jgi:hypothetical protein
VKLKSSGAFVGGAIIRATRELKPSLDTRSVRFRRCLPIIIQKALCAVPLLLIMQLSSIKPVPPSITCCQINMYKVTLPHCFDAAEIAVFRSHQLADF